jgi:hypothetical protein
MLAGHASAMKPACMYIKEEIQACQLGMYVNKYYCVLVDGASTICSRLGSMLAGIPEKCRRGALLITLLHHPPAQIF